MTARADYVGPITKSAEAMFARAERKTIARKLTAPPPSALREIITSFGLSPTIIRRWEEAGLVAFERQGGRVVVNDTTREHLATVIELRAAGFSVKEIAWISETLPPTIKQMRDALAARQAQTVSKPSTQLGSAFRETIKAFGLSLTVVKHWENAGVVAFARQGGRVVVDDAMRESLAMVIELRRAGFSVKEITWISDTLPPTVSQMRQALQARLAQSEAARARSIAGAIVAGCSRG
ncbi:MerR family transcriptional regulator [Caulobacter sp. FWC26]|jgi:DNA-binding transcriptional MerR regulator|uniref:MerR family transcriptional regulator n=1 Tax=Caulobacter sp. FWC26 TaxID=69665 RepID=UPI000C15D0F3|nr:MerR family transcriptional regulator [Caulobacter sp. FWC26]AZS19258.1 MerR family transcriptional regulator [Caulobacter sp. FWC26]